MIEANRDLKMLLTGHDGRGRGHEPKDAKSAAMEVAKGKEIDFIPRLL